MSDRSLRLLDRRKLCRLLRPDLSNGDGAFTWDRSVPAGVRLQPSGVSSESRMPVLFGLPSNWQECVKWSSRSLQTHIHAQISLVICNYQHLSKHMKTTFSFPQCIKLLIFSLLHNGMLSLLNACNIHNKKWYPEHLSRYHLAVKNSTTT